MVSQLFECIDLLKQKTEFICIIYLLLFMFLKDRAYTVFYIFAEKILHWYKTWYVFMDNRQNHATEI